MTEKQLIEKLNKLFAIKPNQEWVSFTKAQILGQKRIVCPMRSRKIITEKANVFEKFASILDIFPALTYQRKLAFALSGILLLTISAVGFIGYSSFNINKEGQVAFIPTDFLTKAQLESANNSLQDLTKLVMENKKEEMEPAISQFKASVNNAVTSLIDAVKKDPKSIKNIAKEVKKIRDSEVLLDIAGGSVDLGNASDILYKTITEQEIANFEQTTLTNEQQKILTGIKELFNNQKYSEAFEKMYTQLSSTSEGGN